MGYPGHQLLPRANVLEWGDVTTSNGTKIPVHTVRYFLPLEVVVMVMWARLKLGSK